jgi:predicted O-methyltransferase YrrM
MSLLSENAVLKELLETGEIPDANGGPLKVHSQICVAFAEGLYQAVLDNQPSVVIEVGMAFGVSTLAILTALRKLGRGGRLISVDPNQSTHWQRGGINNVARAELQSQHQLIEEPDYIALPRLLTINCKPDLAYIDGWHTFDYALLDLWYIDKMLSVKGIIGINDCGWPAIHKAVNWFLTHRHYEEVNVGLKPIYSRKKELSRFLRGDFSKRSRVLCQDRYFRKLEDWEPNYDFYAEF